jgi:phosphoadenosine phosphosulfate reductase
MASIQTSQENDLSAIEVLRETLRLSKGPVKFANSFGAEDVVLLDLIASENLPIVPFVLDTGRLNQEDVRHLGSLPQTVRH